MTAENYHLKWDSHSTYLNSSVATLYKNEKYADVVLYSSQNASTNSSMPTATGILAHKFILSSCSQFFSSIFETSPIVNNGTFYIVLPPELSHRSIQILVQYMYVGEATVSNDILNEVLKGGEILKIRGLCRTSQHVSNVHQRTESQTTNNATYNLIRMPLNSGPTSVRYLVEQQTARSHGAAASSLPPNSPVIMKSTKPLSTLTVPSTVNIGKLPTSAITVNKHVAIDPADKCCYAPETTSVLRDEVGSGMCSDIACNSCSRLTESSQQLMQRENHGQNNEPTMTYTKSCADQCDEERNYMQQGSSDVNEDNHHHMYEQEMLSNMGNEHCGGMRDYEGNANFNYNHLAHSKQTIIREGGETQHLVSSQTSPQPSVAAAQVHEAPPYVSIKEEPTDWLQPTNSMQQSSLESLKKQTGSIDFKTQKIKTEPPPASTSSLNMENENGQLLSTRSDFEPYFSCEICKKRCEDKRTLMRHLETHSATSCSSGGFNASMGDTTVQPKTYVPKKRRRISQQENTSDHVCLQCDICSTRFETPAEWVRHMSTQHTEVELALFNNKKDAEKNTMVSNANQKKLSCNLQQQHAQRVQALSGSTNSNLPNSTSVLCTSANDSINETNAAEYLRSTLSPA